ncbi:MAG: NAD(P)-binding protein, partial [Nitrosopumilus sp.]
MNKQVCVVGAGVGGLTTASLLVKNGYTVKVFEKMS